MCKGKCRTDQTCWVIEMRNVQSRIHTGGEDCEGSCVGEEEVSLGGREGGDIGEEESMGGWMYRRNTRKKVAPRHHAELDTTSDRLARHAGWMLRRQSDNQHSEI